MKYYINLIKYWFKILFANKASFFWVIAFPYILAMFYNASFSNINNFYKFKTIDVGIINNEEIKNNEIIKHSLTSLEEEGKPVFKIKYIDSNEEAEELIKNKQIAGYVTFYKDKEPQIIVREESSEATTIKAVVSSFIEKEKTINNILKESPEKQAKAFENLKKDVTYTIDKTSEKKNFTLHIYLSLLAMAAMYAGCLALNVVIFSEANMSTKGARIGISPIPKYKIITSGLLVALFIEIINLNVLYLYLTKIFNIALPKDIFHTILILTFGVIASFSLAIFIGLFIKGSLKKKNGVLISIIMTLTFFSGGMGPVENKSILEKKLPILVNISPVSSMSKGIYSLFAYDNLNVYWHSLARIVLFIIVLLLLSIKYIRRKSYDDL